jgi:hypothetical protein
VAASRSGEGILLVPAVFPVFLTPLSASAPCTVSSRSVAAACIYAASGVFAFCLFLNQFSPSRENAPLRGRFRYCGSKWSSTPSNPPPWSLVWRKRKSRFLSSLSSSSPSCSRFELFAGLARGPAHKVAYCIHPVPYVKQRWYTVFLM